MAMQCEVCGKPVDEGKGLNGTGVYTFGQIPKAYHRPCWEKTVG